MAGSRPDAAPPLGDFLDALETRLRILPPEQVVAALVSHAARLPGHCRRAFLDIFPDPHARATVAPQRRTPLLLTEIEAFVDRTRALAPDKEDDWYGDRYDWDDWGTLYADPSWVREADFLFAAAGDAFVSGRLDLAREAYGRLLTMFDLEGREGPAAETSMVAATDLDEVAARYLRAVYETTPVAERAAAVHLAYRDLPWRPAPTSLRDIAATRPSGLPDLEAFLPRWIASLLTESVVLSPAHRQRLLAEATLLRDGIEGLAELARRPGSHRQGIYLAWIDALVGAGRLREAADAAREALALPEDAAYVARVADRLATATSALGEHAEATEACRLAWRSAPTRPRLLALVAASDATGDRATVLEAEARGVRDDARLSCELLLLAGHVDEAAAALVRSDPLGWSYPAHPGPVVLPCLLVAATGTTPPATEDSALHRAFAAVDTDPDATWARLEPYDTVPGAPAAGTGDGPATLTDLLLAAFHDHPAGTAERRRWLAAAASAVERHVDAVVRNKQRKGYAGAASLVVAYAETLVIIGRRAAAGTAYVTAVRKRYPRHTAFRAELDTAVGASELVRRRGVRPGHDPAAATAPGDQPRVSSRRQASGPRCR